MPRITVVAQCQEQDVDGKYERMGMPVPDTERYWAKRSLQTDEIKSFCETPDKKGVVLLFWEPEEPGLLIKERFDAFEARLKTLEDAYAALRDPNREEVEEGEEEV